MSPIDNRVSARRIDGHLAIITRFGVLVLAHGVVTILVELVVHLGKFQVVCFLEALDETAGRALDWLKFEIRPLVFDVFYHLFIPSNSLFERFVLQL